MQHRKEEPQSPMYAIHEFAKTLTQRVRELDEMERTWRISPGQATEVLENMIESQLYAIFRTLYMRGSATEIDKKAALEAMKTLAYDQSALSSFAQEYLTKWNTDGRAQKP